MKFSEEVTKEQLESVINWILKDIHDERMDARETFKKDKKDVFHEYMDTMYGLVEEMIKDRLAALPNSES